MEITVTAQGGASVLAVCGRVDTVTAGDLESAINGLIEKGNRKLLLDFGGYPTSPAAASGSFLQPRKNCATMATGTRSAGFPPRYRKS